MINIDSLTLTSDAQIKCGLSSISLTQLTTEHLGVQQICNSAYTQPTKTPAIDALQGVITLSALNIYSGAEIQTITKTKKHTHTDTTPISYSIDFGLDDPSCIGIVPDTVQITYSGAGRYVVQTAVKSINGTKCTIIASVRPPLGSSLVHVSVTYTITAQVAKQTLDTLVTCNSELIVNANILATELINISEDKTSEIHVTSKIKKIDSTSSNETPQDITPIQVQKYQNEGFIFII